jgi:hypothetical protein
LSSLKILDHLEIRHIIFLAILPQGVKKAIFMRVKKLLSIPVEASVITCNISIRTITTVWLQELNHRMEEESSSYSLELECLPPEPSSEFQTARQGRHSIYSLTVVKFEPDCCRPVDYIFFFRPKKSELTQSVAYMSFTVYVNLTT